jgi:hypothetical protein
VKNKLTLLLLLSLISCNDKTLSALPPLEDLIAPPKKTQAETLSELESRWDLETKITDILPLIEETPASPVSFTSSLTWNLSRTMNDNEVQAGNLLTDQIMAEYDDALKNTVASSAVTDFRTNDSLYVTHCISGTAPKTMNGVDGKSYTIVYTGSEYQVLNADNSLRQGGLVSYNKACRYITSDDTGKRYVNQLKVHNVRLMFPVKYKKNGGTGGNARIQSVHGSMVADFCARNFAATDGLDTLGLCL